MEIQNAGYSQDHLNQLARQIKEWGQDLGFQQIAIASIDLSQASLRLQQWLQKGYQGSMHYLSKHGSLRSHPEQLLPGTVRVICARMNYLSSSAHNSINNLNKPEKAYLARYALGRDYHKVMRKRLQQLAARISDAIPEHQYRAFVDSAPVLEKPLAAAAGLGWQGKNTLVINQKDGSWFFLGTIHTNIPLPVDQAVQDRCGQCRACLKICPTQAIVAPYVLDARRCIAYLTIENKGPIPKALRPLMGNRVFGCDDCQLICPWNRYAQHSQEGDFQPRHQLQDSDLLRLFQWTKTEFDQHSRGSAIRRAGYDGWLRNIAVALGNAPDSEAIRAALTQGLVTASTMVAEHIKCALDEQNNKKHKSTKQSKTKKSLQID